MKYWDAMPTLDEMTQDNMACATVHERHAAASVTLLAFLAAHRPERPLSFLVAAPTAEGALWCEALLAEAGVSNERNANGTIVGTAPAVVWTKVLLQGGAALEGRDIVLSPFRAARSR